jgi:hypothetical protein
MNYLQTATILLIIRSAVDKIHTNQEFLAPLKITNEKASEIGVGKIINEICHTIFQQTFNNSIIHLNSLIYQLKEKCTFLIYNDWNKYFEGNSVDDIIRRIFINLIISGGTPPQPNITCTQLFEFVKDTAIQILEIFYDDDIKSVYEMHKLSTLYPTNALIYVAYEIKSSSGYISDHIDKSNAMEGGSVNNKRNVFKNGKIRSISKRVRRTRRKQTRQAN